jgi:hypothetical protein
MTTHIDVTAVDSVLLADGWHSVELASFGVDVIEYIRDGKALLPGGVRGAGGRVQLGQDEQGQTHER